MISAWWRGWRSESRWCMRAIGLHPRARHDADGRAAGQHSGRGTAHTAWLHRLRVSRPLYVGHAGMCRERAAARRRRRSLLSLPAVAGLEASCRGMAGARRPVRAVDGVTFSLPAGDVLGVVGESGCGKSTLARLIMGLLPPTSGEVLVDGRSLAGMDRRERARMIQPVFQDPYSSLNPRQRVRDIVGLPLAAQGDLPKVRQVDRVMAMLARVGFSSEMAERMPGQLSGGQRQRVAIARALVLHPRIVVCDEPTSALDVSVQAQILNLLAELRRELGLTYLFISHNLAVVEHIATE